MKLSKSQKLVILFIGIFIIKAIVNLLMKKPFILSDEPCSFIKARYLAEHLRFASCSEATGLIENGNPQPLYSIIIAPIFFFLKGSAAYKAILVFNAFLISTIVFPLNNLFKKFIGDKRINYLFIFLIAFLPQIVTFEKTLMTESLFIVIGLWFLQFYLASFEKKKNATKFKFTAIILSILAVFTRPFGFLITIAVAINEFSQSKNKKNIALIYLPLAIIVTIITIVYFVPKTISALEFNTQNLELETGPISIVHALIKQINSFTLATLLIPLIIFASYIKERKLKPLNKIRWFLVSFIGLSFLISTYHLYGYLVKGKVDPGLITRYINLPLVLIYIFTFIFLQKYKKFKANYLNIGIGILTVGSIIFLKYQAVKQTLNLDLTYLYDTHQSTRFGIVFFKEIFLIPIIITTVLLTTAFLLNKRKILIGLLTIIIVTQSALTSHDIIKIGSFIPKITRYLMEKENNILFLKHASDKGSLSFNYWEAQVLSKTHIESLTIQEGTTDPNKIIEFTKEDIRGLQTKFDFIITPLKLNLPIITIESPLGTGGYSTEKIYNLR